MKKPFYKRWWFILIAVIVIIGALGGSGEDEPEDVVQEPIEQVASSVNDTVDKPKETVKPKEVEKPEDNVSREFKNALRSAQNYIDIMAFSEKGLYDQLTSEYGENYPAEAAQYAIENVEVDWFEEALESAIHYLEVMPMSDDGLFDQLTSEYGEQFTEEQAQYAIDNLPD